MTIHIAHRSDLAGRRPVKIDGRLVGWCRQVVRRHGAGTQVRFYLPGDTVAFATFETVKDLRAALPRVLAENA